MLILCLLCFCVATVPPTLPKGKWSLGRRKWKTATVWRTVAHISVSQNPNYNASSPTIFLSHQAVASGDLNWERALCYKQQHQRLCPDEWVSTLCADKVSRNKGRNQVQRQLCSKFGRLSWLQGGEQGRLVWSICLWIRSSKKSKGKMVDELTGKEAWGLHWLPTWLHTAALERNTSVYPCGHFYCFADMQEEDHQQYSGFNFSSLVEFLEVYNPNVGALNQKEF